MPFTTTTTYSDNSHAPATYGEASIRRSPSTDALYRSTQASGGVVGVPVAIHHPEDGVPGSLDTRRDGQGNAARDPVVDNRIHKHTYVPPQPITPIQAILKPYACQTSTALQPGPSLPLTHGANEPAPSQRGTPNNSVQNTQNVNYAYVNNTNGNPHARPTRNLARSRSHPRAMTTFAPLNDERRTSGDLNKWPHVPQVIRENRIRVPAIQETHLGVGSAVSDPANPEDRDTRADGGPQIPPNGEHHRLLQPQPWADEIRTNRAPPNGEDGHNGLINVPNTAQRRNGAKARVLIASLNIKGRKSGEIDKWMHVPQIMRERNIGIMAIQETHLTEELANQFETLFENRFTLYHSPDPETRNARGIAIVLNKKVINTNELEATTIVPGRAIAMTIPWLDNQKLKILAVYAPNAPRETKLFWKSINKTINDNPNLSPNIMLGDFNLVEDALDRLPTKSDDHQNTETLRNFRLKHNLVDGWRKSHPDEKGYSWSRDSDGTQSRIDRIYIREDFFNECKDWEIHPAPIPTDHDIVSARISTPSSPAIGRGRWAIPTRLLKNKKIKDEVQKLALKLEDDLSGLRSRTPRRNPQTMLREFKRKVLDTARTFEKKMQPMITMKITKLSESLRTIRNDRNLPEEEIRIATTKLKKEIQCLLRESHQSSRDKLSAIDAAEGESIGKTWSNRFKESKPRDTIKCLRDPRTNNTTRDSKDMTEIAAKHYEDIQSADHDPHTPPNERNLDEILSQLKSRVSNESKRKIVEEISEDEVHIAIKKTSNGKAPGPDGIPIELWKMLDDRENTPRNGQSAPRKCNIVWILTKVFQDIEEHGMDKHAKLNEGCISPIYKKKDPENITNYRPITLLNTDYKIYTKALSLRLADVAPEVVNTDQAGFITGRSIFDQVKTTKLVIDYMNTFNKTGAIVALDQEKAYDRILHQYLWEVLRKFEFPEKFIKLVQNLYDNAATVVMINGELSAPFIVSRGIRQGDALSCLLFNIAIEPLAESIRRSNSIAGIQIPGTRKQLKVKLFADDTTVFLSDQDSIDNLQTILSKWCKVSGAKFNIEKTEIIPLGNTTQRSEINNSRKLNKNSAPLPNDVHIARDGEPVRILGAWLGNEIDLAVTWAPVIENCIKRLRKWKASKHSLEGRRLIIQMQVAGVTQYLTKVQGMPQDIEHTLNTQIRRFLWNNERIDTVNQAQMNATHEKGGKKVLDIEARNKAIHLTWLKAYLNIGNNRATWAYFADALIGHDIPKSHQIDKDPESRIMPFLQTWSAKSVKSTLPEDLRKMLKLAKEFNTQIRAANPSHEARINLPIWYHIHSDPSARKLYKTKKAKCLRRKHGMKLVSDALHILDNVSNEHIPAINCKCESCKQMRSTHKCSHPHECINLMAMLISKIHPRWNPKSNDAPNNEHTPRSNEHDNQDEVIMFNKCNSTADLKDAITIFNTEQPPHTGNPPTHQDTETHQSPTTVYTDGACNNNGDENAAAGYGIWYGEDDHRNVSTRVPLKTQSNQTGELMAILHVAKSHPQDEDLKILTDSRYAVDGLTKNLKRWEERNWIDTHHGDLFKCITAWMRWRKGKTYLKWIKGHSGIMGNEEADKLAGEGALKPLPHILDALDYPPNDPTPDGASIAKLEQRDFYKIIRDKKRIPKRSRTERNLENIQSCTKDTFGSSPTTETIWKATKHKDFTRKTRDFLWKSTQNAYKIGEYWKNIEGYTDRGTCPICEETEDMEHILTRCSTEPRSTAWNLANEVWARRHNEPLPKRIGDILGCGLANFKWNGKPDKGKNRLYRILISETAYLIWKMRNERRIRDEDNSTNRTDETINRWTRAINKRLTIDRILTDSKKFKRKALDKKLVKATWRNCLKNEDDLPTDWLYSKEVLVGISQTRPPGNVG